MIGRLMLDRRPRILPVDRLISITVDNANAPVAPLTLDLVKLQQRISHVEEDAILALWIAAARAYVEEATGRQTINAVWELTIYEPVHVDALELPRPPLVNVEAVTFDDGDGAAQILDPAAYVVTPSRPAGGPVDPHCPPGRIALASGATWPAPPIRIRRTCGYGATPAEMPALVQAALCLYVGHLYANREAVSSQTLTAIPIGLQAIIDALKWTAFDVAGQGRVDPDAIGAIVSS
jgi:uncharacterized phiE125 gp8 family phage protein